MEKEKLTLQDKLLLALNDIDELASQATDDIEELEKLERNYELLSDYILGGGVRKTMEKEYICPNCGVKRTNDFPISDETNQPYCPDCNEELESKWDRKVHDDEPELYSIDYNLISRLVNYFAEKNYLDEEEQSLLDKLEAILDEE